MISAVERAASAMLSMQRYPWEQGVAAQALFEQGMDSYWIPMACEAVHRSSSDGRLAMLRGVNNVTDPASNGETVWRAWKKTGDSRFRDGAENMLHYLTEQAPRTNEGLICHVLPEPGSASRQIWVDSIYMLPPFLAVMGCFDEAIYQLKGYVRLLRDPETGLLFHIYDDGEKKWIRKVRWATGNGWALLGMIRVYEEAKTRPRDIMNEAFLLLESMIRYQRDDGLFHDILDDPESFADGTSALMMAAFIYRAFYNGEKQAAGFIPNAERAFRTMTEKIDDFGILRDVCGSPDFKHSGTSVEAQAAYLMAEAWRKRISL